MSINAKIRLTLGAVAMSTAAMACGGTPDVATAPKVKQNGITFSAKASAKSQSALQITRWHSTVESGVHGAIVLDGQDRVGRVQYLQTAFVDAKTHTAHVQVMLPEKGELVWDIDSLVVLSNTIPASVQPYARGIYYDFQLAHPLRGGAVQAYSYLSAGIKIAAGAALVVGGSFVDATVLGLPVGAAMQAVGARLIANGIVDAVYASDKIAPDSAPKTTDSAATPSADTKDPAAASTDPAAAADNSAAAVKDAVDSANPGASPTETSAANNGSDPAMPGSDPAMPTQAPDNSAPAPDNSAAGNDPAGAATDGTALPPDNSGGNLDNVNSTPTAADNGESSPTPDPGTGGGDNSPAPSDPGPSDNAGDNGGADQGGGDQGGGDPGGSSESAHICRKVAVSAKTKIRACVHY